MGLYKKYSGTVDNSGNVPLLKQEREYLKELQQAHRIFKVIMNPDIPPYAYFDENGKACGILPDLFAIIAQRAGIEYEFVPSSTRAEYEQQVADGVADIDLTSYANYDAAEKNNLELTRSFFDTSMSYVSKKDFSGIFVKNIFFAWKYFSKSVKFFAYIEMMFTTSPFSINANVLGPILYFLISHF